MQPFNELLKLPDHGLAEFVYFFARGVDGNNGNVFNRFDVHGWTKGGRRGGYG